MVNSISPRTWRGRRTGSPRGATDRGVLHPADGLVFGRVAAFLFNRHMQMSDRSEAMLIGSLDAHEVVACLGKTMTLVGFLEGVGVDRVAGMGRKLFD